MDEEFDCVHIAEAAVNVNVDVQKMRATLNSRSCNVCLRIDQLWMCMECKQILCGHIALGHTTAHFTFLNKHCLYINIESAAIYCYLCDSEVEPKNHDDELNRLRQFILYNQGPSTINRNRRRQPAPKVVVPPKKTCLKRGPRATKTVAITNNGTKRSNNAIKQTYSEPVKKIPEAKIVQKVQVVNVQEVPVKVVKAKTPAKPKRRKARRGVTKRRTYNKAPKKPLTVVKPKQVVKTIKPKKFVFKRGPRTDKKVGISNSGNNCFMNAVWQALRHLRPFVYCLKLFKFHDNIVINNNRLHLKNGKISISDELLKLMTSLTDWKKPPNYKSRDSVSPAALHALVCKIKPRYKGFHQHDAHEFLMFTLDTLHSEQCDEKHRLFLEEGNTDDTPKIDTLVSLLFRGYLLSEVMCMNCKSVFSKNDPFIDISLDVPDYKNSPLEPCPEDLITDCLERYIGVEELNESNVYFCSTCKSQQNITKRFYINNLPNILCLQLKRFRWDNVYRTKVHTHVKFPTQSLDMSKYLNDEMKKTLTKEAAYMFDLSSIIVHAGEGSGSGHYTTYAVDDKEDQWYEYNDEKVYEVGEPMVESVQAYILIYIKREVKLNLCL